MTTPKHICVAPTADTVVRQFVIQLGDESDEIRTYTYDDLISGRSFVVRRTFDGKGGHEFMLTERIPNGLRADVGNGGSCAAHWNDDLLAKFEKEYGPNRFILACRVAKIDRASIIFKSETYSADTIYHETLKHCAEAIVGAIEKDVRYSSKKVLTDDEKRRMELDDRIASERFWLHRDAVIRAADEHSSGIFRGTHTPGGRLLSKETKNRILGYLNEPSLEKWLDVRGLSITASATLWQAWIASDSTAPRTGNSKFPTPEVLRTSIQAAVERNRQTVAVRLKEASKAVPRPR